MMMMAMVVMQRTKEKQMTEPAAVLGGGHGAVRRARLISAKQLECPRWAAGVCVYRGYPGVSGLIRRKPHFGNLASAASSPNAQTTQVSMNTWSFYLI